MLRITRKKKVLHLLKDHNLQVANLNSYDDFIYAIRVLKHILNEYGHTQDLERRYIAIKTAIARFEAKADYADLLNLKESQKSKPLFL